MLSEYMTSDMAEAAYLTQSGFTHQRLEHRQGRAYWVFLLADGARDALAVYQNRDARVEPRGFTQSLAHVRGAMYEFLDAQRA